MATAAKVIAATAAQSEFILAARAAHVPQDQLRHFLRGGYVPQPKQCQFHAAARLCDRPDGPTKIGFGGARGPGKSHAGLAQVALDDCQRYPGLKFLYLRKIGVSGREAIDDQRRSVLHATPHEYKVQEGTISFPNDSRIRLGHFQNEKDIDKYLGLEYDGALIEEATQLSRRKVKDVATCVRSSKPGWRPRQYFTTNPGNIGHVWFKDLFIVPFRKGTERETRFIPATVYDNRHVNREYRAELESLTGWQRKAWLEGDWDIAAGQFFTTWRQGVHVVKPLPVEEHHTVWASKDYGFTHWTMDYLLVKDGDGNMTIAAERGQRQWLSERHAADFKAMIEREDVELHRLRSFVAGADCFSKRHDGSTIAKEYAKHGLRLTPANDDRINGAAAILELLGDAEANIPAKLFVSEKCPRLIECIPALQHDPHRPEDVLKVDCDDDGAGGDDPYDAARYGVMAGYRRRLDSIGS